MHRMSRRELIRAAGIALGADALAHGDNINSQLMGSEPLPDGRLPIKEWIRSPRIILAEGYNAPFYPAFRYDPEAALRIARQLNADALRYPTAAFYAYFPTATHYPVHPGLGPKDPLGETVGLFHREGLRVIAYVPLNVPFMSISSRNPEYQDWVRRDLSGKPLTSEIYGYGPFYEGCLNSPLRDVIHAFAREVLTRYAIDVMYFDGPYEGMEHRDVFCHCHYCEAAYRAAHGKPVPTQNQAMSLDDEIEYRQWMSEEVVLGFLREIREMIRQTRDVPVLFNDTGLLSKGGWRNRGWTLVDGFMFEEAQTPEEKLFNLQLGKSTNKVVWTYLSSHTVYNRAHLKDKEVRGWYSYPVEREELLMDGAVAMAAQAGFVYWGLSRFYSMPQPPLTYPAGRYLKETFDFAAQHRDLFSSARPRPQAALVVGSQTIDWYRGRHFVGDTYSDYYRGAFQVFKENSYDVQPVLDYTLSGESLAAFPLVYVPNAVCLSDAQCSVLARYAESGGTLIVTHLTSTADEHGRIRPDYGLREVLGITLHEPEPVEIPDIYLRILASGRLIPQDPQIARFQTRGAKVLAETYDLGRLQNLGPAVTYQRIGKGTVFYIGSGLEAVYLEARIPALRSYVASLFDPVLAGHRTYRVERRPGLIAQLASTRDIYLLHLLADTGDKWKQYDAREDFVPLTQVKVQLRVPAGRTVKSVSLLRSRQRVSWALRSGWADLVVPQVLVHEVVRMDLQ